MLNIQQWSKNHLNSESPSQLSRPNKNPLQTSERVCELKNCLTPEEICHQFLPLVRQHALRMELHAFHREILMPQAHDDARSVFVRSPCADLQIVWQILLGDDQRMVAGRGHRRGQAAKDGFSLAINFTVFAVDQVLQPKHL